VRQSTSVAGEQLDNAIEEKNNVNENEQDEAFHLLVVFLSMIMIPIRKPNINPKRSQSLCYHMLSLCIVEK